MARELGQHGSIPREIPDKTRARRARLFTIANGISLLRVALLPWVLFLISRPPGSHTVELIGLAVVIALTDFFDGFVARRTGQVSHYGRIMDPVADKICLVLASWWLTVYRGLPVWIPVLLVVRDAVILGGSFVLLRRHDVVLPSNQLGRVTTFVLTITLFAYLIAWEAPQRLLVWLSGALVVATFVSYVRIGWIIFRRFDT
ncbi:MAG TPA: CDP-alcohol phosphatidyltransferase family protein [Candidatus Latescibacteria bacterium]|nr:CDP-alcohol phosphatidyltransferase family protein [Candidatus Latescibacterota bacterium]